MGGGRVLGDGGKGLLREAPLPCINLLLHLEFFKKFRVGGGGGGVPSEFTVLLWSRALVLDLDQAEQNCQTPTQQQLKNNSTKFGFDTKLAPSHPTS